MPKIAIGTDTASRGISILAPEGTSECKLAMHFVAADLGGRDFAVLCDLAGLDVRRHYLLPLLSDRGVQRALQLIGVPVNLAVFELRDVDARSCTGRSGERQAMSEIEVRENEIRST